MRTTVFLDDNLVAEAKRLTGNNKTSRVLQEALREFVEKRNREWLATMGGSIPDLELVTRRRFD
ncbi:hypothetical protein FACS1894104_5320 [Actinomycetota bacterium]|nr:hypothetical protein FACS1894104_5320 [Actinomycetota bacterium]